MTREHALELLHKPHPCGLSREDADLIASIEAAHDAGVPLPPIRVSDRGVMVDPRWQLLDGNHRLFVARRRALAGLHAFVGTEKAFSQRDYRHCVLAWIPLSELDHCNLQRLEAANV
jgi:hypothetical protein